MKIRVYNSLSGKKEVFEPLVPGKVGMYVCGVTVYDRCHIGHARSAIVFDVIRRYLVHRGFDVRYIRNFTDVDDKIVARAQEEGIGWKALAEKYIAEYNMDMSLLRVKRADVEPKATDFIREMQEIIGELMAKGYAYRLPGGVYYRVRRFSGYGKLSKREPEEMMAGARVEVDAAKENPLDFALWKAVSKDDPSWESPWGSGRPGWHIECSAMSLANLGQTFDIHGGGMDLLFPHHENEIAQSEAYTGKPFARYWMHNGFVNVNQEKMSKSLGNFFTVREIFEKCRESFRTYSASSDPDAVTAEVLRYFLLSTHYRSPLDFSDAALTEAHGALNNFYNLFQKLDEAVAQDRPHTPTQDEVSSLLSDFVLRFEAAMDDDFNTAAVLAEFQKLRGEINAVGPERLSGVSAEKVREVFSSYGEILGLFTISPADWPFDKRITIGLHWTESEEEKVRKMRPADRGVVDEQITRRVAERDQARRDKNWKRADEIRKELEQMGIILEDRPDGTTRIKR